MGCVRVGTLGSSLSSPRTGEEVQLPLLCLRDADRKLCDALSPSYQMLKLGRWDGSMGKPTIPRLKGWENL